MCVNYLCGQPFINLTGAVTPAMAIKKYLQRYAEPETAALARLQECLPADHVWSDVVVIPACNENSDFLRAPPPANGRSLMILVINQIVSARPSIVLANQSLFDEALTRCERMWDSGQSFSGFKLLLLKDTQAHRDILLVDKFRDGHQLPPKGGVGNARKIGADLATYLIHAGRIESRWIRCTDADVKLPDSYFGCTAEHASDKDIAALIYPFRHGGGGAVTASDNVGLATQLYELSLRYYVAAFEAAGSPYAFHTIGSTIAIDVNHYAKVRGFPRRAAGEDFYLLNKLAKSGKVLQMEAGPPCQPIRIAARLSERVPFGTGAAVNKMTALEDLVQDYRFYDPRVFGLLGLWLQSWPAIWQAQSSQLQGGLFAGYVDCALLLSNPQAHEVRCLLDALRTLRTEAALQHAFRQSKSPDQFDRHMRIWFDAFRSLKLIHALRDQLLPSISFGQLCDRPEYVFLLTRDADLSECHDQLVG